MSDDGLDDPFGSDSMQGRDDDDLPETLPLPLPSLLPASLIRENSSKAGLPRSDPDTSNIFSSPAKKRSRYVISHLSSSSLKKRTKKTSHCHFCPRQRCRTSLEQHLKESEECFNLYCRLLKVRSMNAVLLKLFSCLGCDKTGNFKLTPHLPKSLSCYKIYQSRFEATSIKDLSKKMKNCTRQSNSSRQSLSRKIENVKARESRADSKTVSQAVNDFKTSTALSNYRRCFKCSGNYLDSGTKEVDPSADEFEEDSLLLKPELMRMNKFYICHACSNGRTCKQVGNQENILTSELMNGSKILKPCNPDSNNNPLPNFEVNGGEQILIPTNIGSLNIFKNKKLNQPNNVTRIIYNYEEPTPDDLSSLYIDRLLKFKNRKDYYERVVGTIGDDRHKILSKIVPIIDTSDIHSSDQWEEAKRTATKFRFKQFGPSSIGFQITTDPSEIETIATALIIGGRVITVSFDGDESFDLQTKYFFHPHSTSEECPGDNCQKLDLEEIIEKIEEESEVPTFNQKFISSYICSVYQKTHSLVESLIKTRSFELHSEDYFVGIKFNSQGSAIIEGSLWPAECANFNETLSNCSLSGEDTSFQKESFLRFIDKSVFTTVSPEILQHKLNLQNDKARDMSELVARNQLDLESNPKMLGIESVFLEKPEGDAESNIRASKDCIQIFRDLLLPLTDEAKLDLSIPQWFENLGDKLHVEINEEFVVLWHVDQKIIFKKDDRLVKVIHRHGELMGIYQYAVSCSDICGGIVLKGEHLSNFYTHPYNPTLMRAFRCKMKVFPVHGSQDWVVNTELKQGQVSAESEEAEAFFSEEDSHRRSSLIELYALADPKKIQDINSSPTEFVDCTVAGDSKFRKVKEETDETYKFEGTDGFFELLSSNILRHKQRRNGKHLLLAETCMNYDFLGKAKSKEVYEIFDKRLDKIPQADVKSIYEDTDGKKLMPEYILSSNSHVMKIRKRPKILMYHDFPENSADFKRNKVMLFFPLNPGMMELSREVIGKEKYNSCNILLYMSFIDEYFYSREEIEGPVDGDCRMLTTVEQNER